MSDFFEKELEEDGESWKPFYRLKKELSVKAREIFQLI